MPPTFLTGKTDFVTLSLEYVDYCLLHTVLMYRVFIGKFNFVSGLNISIYSSLLVAERVSSLVCYKTPWEEEQRPPSLPPSRLLPAIWR